MSMGSSLGDQLTAKTHELKQAVLSIGEEAALRRPAEGEWCAKEILSHLAGEDGSNVVDRLRRFLSEDTPELEVQRGVTAFTPARRQESLPDLMSRVEGQFAALGAFLAGPSDEHFSRKAHVPLLKDNPLGEYPTLGQYAGFIVDFHIAGHINQVRALAE